LGRACPGRCGTHAAALAKDHDGNVSEAIEISALLTVESSREEFGYSLDAVREPYSVFHQLCAWLRHVIRKERV
jgi:hypothetical protein